MLEKKQQKEDKIHMHTYIYREEINTPAKLKLSVKLSNEGNSRNTYRHIIYREYL